MSIRYGPTQNGGSGRSAVLLTGIHGYLPGESPVSPGVNRRDEALQKRRNSERVANGGGSVLGRRA